MRYARENKRSDTLPI